jgi:hypothetical protein
MSSGIGRYNYSLPQKENEFDAGGTQYAQR